MPTGIPMDVVMGVLLQTCFQNEQQRANAIGQALQVTFPGTASVVNYGSVTPDVNQQQFPWFRLNSDGSPDGWYSFWNGMWVRPNPAPPGSGTAGGGETRIWDGDLTSLATYDGGEGNWIVQADGTIIPSIAISATTGPMWAPSATMQGVFPLGVNNTSVAAQIKDAFGNVINNWPQGTTGGEIQHTLLTTEMPPHFHVVPTTLSTAGPNTWQGGTHTFYPPMDGTTNTTTVGGATIGGNANTPIGHNNLPPYRSVYFITRTARAYYRLTA